MITSDRFYQAKLKHDKGTVKITVLAPNRAAAIKRICLLEGCPERAILTIKIRKRKV